MKEKRKRRTTNIAEEQAIIIEKMSEYRLFGIAGTVKLLLQEALAARNNAPLPLSSLRSHLETREYEELIEIMRIILDLLENQKNQSFVEDA